MWELILKTLPSRGHILKVLLRDHSGIGCSIAGKDEPLMSVLEDYLLDRINLEARLRVGEVRGPVCVASTLHSIAPGPDSFLGDAGGIWNVGVARVEVARVGKVERELLPGPAGSKASVNGSHCCLEEWLGFWIGDVPSDERLAARLLCSILCFVFTKVR